MTRIKRILATIYNKGQELLGLKKRAIKPLNDKSFSIGKDPFESNNQEVGGKIVKVTNLDSTMNQVGEWSYGKRPSAHP